MLTNKLFFIFIILFLCISSFSSSQIFTDGFNSYTSGNLGTQGGWTPYGPGAQIQVESTTPLNYPGYEGSDGGNYITLPQGNNAWHYRTFTGQNLSGDFNLWLSFIIRINANSNNGSYILSLRDIDNKNDGAMLYINQGSSSSYVKFGICKLSQIGYTGDYPLNSSHLIVLKYSYHSSGIDTFFIWVNPTLGISEPSTSTATAFDAATNDPNWSTSVNYMELIPKNQNVGCSIDGIRFANSWQQAPMPVKLESFSSNVIDNKVNLKWITSEEVNNKGFEIIRDGISIGWVDGKGNSNSHQAYSFEDKGLQTGKYNYELKQVDYNGNYNIIGRQLNLKIKAPEKLIVEAYPNPFNPSTEIRYTILNKSFVKMTLYDLNGREIKSLINGIKEQGYHTEKIDAGDLAAGIYFCKIKSNDFSKTIKLILLK